ncbi:MAG: 3-deoxy-7-phosphoheptulonate synthase [Christensenellales bacterium]|jgi:3-deoxy-7-phosphoheptulonate synthase
MIIIMKRNASEQQIDVLLQEIVRYDLQTHLSHGTEHTIVGLVGDTYQIDREKIALLDGVERVMPVQEPYKKANRKFHPQDTMLDIHGITVGGGAFAVAAGPCSVESEAQIEQIAHGVKKSGAKLLRGGAFKPRTSPYSFQGLEKKGLELLRLAREASGLPMVTEIISPRQVDMFDMLVDVIQIGARNMQNFDLLKEVGKLQKPILLKRGMSSTIEEWLMSAEYIMSRGNEHVILCERGIRTFEPYTRNTLDLSAIPLLKRLTHLPVVVDPSHATGDASLVEPLSLAAVMAGADGLLIEVHNDPKRALCDGAQSLDFDSFAQLMEKVSRTRALLESIHEGGKG